MVFAWRTAYRGFTLVEVVLALTVLAIALLAFYTTYSRALVLSETDKQVKIALFDAQSIVEEMQGLPFDEIMDPDYPSYTNPKPRFRHLQYVSNDRLYGVGGQPHLEGELVQVWYGTALDTTCSFRPDPTVAKPLPWVAGTDAHPDDAVPLERYRPANNSYDNSEFITPEPLYVTVEVTWVGPVNKVLDGHGGYVRDMVQRISFVRSR
ncbi:MAG: prepilin-type N-terminal cleavage/methylation domain-containing protein [Planctomycetota bacterium]|nr:prepilin-type N-terminal cleavage/methylation domain-containing protein [Planctomycetota bacterium]